MTLPREPDPLALSTGLTKRTQELCTGLGSDAAELLDFVTPATAELLKWWSSDDMVAARGDRNRPPAPAGRA